MPIYEYYCPDNHRLYQFYAKTLAQGRTVPRCPDNPKFKMVKALSSFAVTGRSGEQKPEAGGQMPEAGAAMGGGEGADDARMEAAMGEMEREFSSVDENDPRAMGRMMRRMSELTGEKLDGGMEEVVRKLEEGADPESLEELGDGEGGEGLDDLGAEVGGGTVPPGKKAKDARARARIRRGPALRDPKLYDYE